MLLLLLACTPDATTPPPPAEDTGTDWAAWCEEQGFGPHVPWDDAGPYGDERRDLADDVTLTLLDGTTWSLQEQWTGCESHLFIPDSLLRSGSGDIPLWKRDVDTLVAGSPRNAHYYFVSTTRDVDVAAENIGFAQDRVAAVLEDLPEEDAAWWAAHLHVVDGRAQDVGGWFEKTLVRGIGILGLGVDRAQRLRGVGSLADNTRYDSSLGDWPYEDNLGFIAHEARYYNMEAERQARLDAEDVTEIPLWTGEVIEMYADMEVTLPSAEEMATFDTFEVDVDMRCPDATNIEYGNCGAWDYLAYLFVEEDDGSFTELSRFITTYHREARWVNDATPMLAKLRDGGTRTFRWYWAPEWNVQPTETRLSLRFSNQGKGLRPTEITPLFTGGSFGSTYNDGREAVEVDVPAGAAKVELWSIITGHGMATNNCAEFCNTEHTFQVGQSSYLYDFPVAGTSTGCIDEIEDQMTPNQWGTWWYGRGGWCPGRLVTPFSSDVTADVTPGAATTVTYTGSYEGGAIPDGSGDIALASWLVVYE